MVMRSINRGTVRALLRGLVSGAVDPPVITSSATFNAAENQTAVGTITATGAAPITFSISGTDSALFEIDEDAGVLTFADAPDYETPGDDDTDNVYDLTVTATNAGGATNQNVAVTVTDVYETTASDYDGTNDYQLRGADLTGIADGKTGIISAWVRIDGGDGTTRVIFNAGAARFKLGMSTGNLFTISGFNTAGSFSLNMSFSDAFTAGEAWLHVLSSWDLENNLKHWYINEITNFTAPTFNNSDLDYTAGNYSIGAATNAAQKFNGCMSELFFHTSYLDLSVEANRRKFIDANGKPVDLGQVDGSIPLGVQPLLYAPTGDASGTGNKGSGGAFTTTGTLDACSSSPSDSL